MRISDWSSDVCSSDLAELSEGFFKALIEHPVPCEERAIRLIQNSSAAIDIYIWLCYRLHALRKPTIVPWPKLYEQFGSAYARIPHFKPRFIACLRAALAVYPDAKVELIPDGVRLMPSPPAVPQARVHQVIFPARVAAAGRTTAAPQLAFET